MKSETITFSKKKKKSTHQLGMTSFGDLQNSFS